MSKTPGEHGGRRGGGREGKAQHVGRVSKKNRAFFLRVRACHQPPHLVSTRHTLQKASDQCFQSTYGAWENIPCWERAFGLVIPAWVTRWLCFCPCRRPFGDGPSPHPLHHSIFSSSRGPYVSGGWNEKQNNVWSLCKVVCNTKGHG